MLSALLISYITNATCAKKPPQMNAAESSANANSFDIDGKRDCGIDEDQEGDGDEDDYGGKECEEISLKIILNKDRTLHETNQVVDYLYRGGSLCSMMFYDFCRCVRLEKVSTGHTKNTADTRLGVLKRHELKQGHPLAAMHQLIKHTNEARGEGINLLIPHVVGMSIPRKSDKGYHMFALAHFIPFNIDHLLLCPSQTVTDVFDSSVFSSRHLHLLDNWEAIHEYQDEWDAEQMQRHAEQVRESHAMTRVLHSAIEGGETTEIDVTRAGCQRARDIEAELLVNVMQECGWVRGREQQPEHCMVKGNCESPCPEPPSSQLKVWATSVKCQENELMARHRNAANVTEQAEISKTEMATETMHFPLPSTQSKGFNNICMPVTEVPKQGHKF